MDPIRPTSTVDRRAARTLATALALALLAVPAALASDGAIEINQARALAGGVTPGDAPGFPVTLSVPGSYRLTSNLDLTVAPDPKNTSGIVVDVVGISIDLNGFAILGEVVCTLGATVTCTPSGGTGWGVFTTGDHYASVVSNGSVVGMGDNGVLAWRVHDVHAQWNGSGGILANLVRDTVAFENGGTGVLSRAATSVYANRNGSTGIESPLVRGSLGEGNIGTGISGEFVAHSSARYNQDSGIYGVMVQESYAEGNAGYGIEVGNTALDAIGSSVLNSNNAGGDQTNATLELGDNLCNGGPCP